MSHIFLTVVEMLGISDLVADSQFALRYEVVVTACNLAFDDHDFLHIRAEVDCSDGFSDILRKIITQRSAPTIHCKGNQFHRKSRLVIPFHITSGDIMQGPDLIFFRIPNQGVTHIWSRVGDSHQDGFGDNRPDISGTRCRNTIFSQNRFGKTEGKLTGIELSGGTNFKAGDGKSIATMVRHQLFDCNIELHIIFHIFCRHVDTFCRGY